MHRTDLEARKLCSWKRAEILEAISAGISDRHEEFARTIALEAGKPIRTARAEVDRAVFTFKVAAEESKRIYGELIPLDWLPGTEGRIGYVRRVELGLLWVSTPIKISSKPCERWMKANLACKQDSSPEMQN